MTVVITYCNIFLPLLLTLLSDNLVLLLTLSHVTVPLPPTLVSICWPYRIDYSTIVMYLTLRCNI